MAQKRSEGVVQQVIGKVKETAGKVLGSRKAKTDGKREQAPAKATPGPATAKKAGTNKASPQKSASAAKAKPAQKSRSAQRKG
jgi:uncharacterized protein YjbJ (UPF0337 family)